MECQMRFSNISVILEDNLFEMGQFIDGQSNLINVEADLYRIESTWNQIKRFLQHLDRKLNWIKTNSIWQPWSRHRVAERQMRTTGLSSRVLYMQVSIFPQILYINSYWVCHLTAKGEDGTGLGICLSVLRGSRASECGRSALYLHARTVAAAACLSSRTDQSSARCPLVCNCMFRFI